MGIRQFNIDLRAAIEAADDFPCVSNLRKGDSDGELAFTYTNSSMPQEEARQPRIDIQALSTDPDSYPRHPGFLIFTSSDTPASLEQWLQDTSRLTKGWSVKDVITTVSRVLTKKLNLSDYCISQEPLIESMEPSGDSIMDDDEDSSYDDDYDYLDLDPLPPSRPALQDTPRSARVGTVRLKRHLREARKAGFHISIPTEGEDVTFRLFSLSIRVSTLAIPEEALEAWGLEPSEYVVLVFKLWTGYPSLSEFLQLPSDQTTVQCRFGKCAGPEPSYESMIRMFSRQLLEQSNPDEEGEGEESDPKSPFVPIYMSLSLDTLLNKTFPGLLRLRLSERISWEQAQEMLFQLSRGNHLSVNSNSSQDIIVQRDRVASADRFGLEFLRHDYVSDDTNDLNIILVAMQFSLQRFIKCTKYCLVCHQRVDEGFEAVKPFVCDNSLCLYQYLSLGFCQSIEQEIINNPYVVDLLVSFFYSAAASSRLREFPRGLGLKCASSAFALDSTKPIIAEACFELKTLKFQSSDYPKCRSIGEGQCVLLVVGRMKSLSTPIFHTNVEKHICMIDSCRSTDFTFEIMSTSTTPLGIVPNPTDKKDTQDIAPTPGGVEVTVFKYEQDIDMLKPAERDRALLSMAEGIPSVEEMRDYLTGRPGRRLTSWKRMGSSTLGLLNWIVASNRSFIVQDAQIPGATSPDVAMPENKLVGGMKAGWMQFRFAQGSPEKEQLFLKHLPKKRYPSLFAWHGSPLSNWHSIIRTGLDFSVVAHGRAYGNGVYFSKDFTVSSGYMGGHQLTYNSWGNSVLKITNAISICELVNEPNKFLSTNPHFVVENVDWIQCRYLFIEVHRTSTRSSPNVAATTDTAYSDSSMYLEQDPSHVLVCGKRKVAIPKSAIPISRRRVRGQDQSSAIGSSVGCPILLDDSVSDSSSSAEADAELDYLLASDDENTIVPTTARKRRRTSTDSGLGETRLLPSQISNVTPFQPGQVDISSLPKLTEPTWAASSLAALRALSNHIKDLQKIQSSHDLAILGWYIDFEKLENMFHWIVELHSFDKSLLLAQDMIRYGCSSIVLELRFGASFPISPPFVRVIRPRFLPFAQGGGGHVTVGGAICSELLTNSGWSPALSLEKVFLEVRMNLCEKDPPARLERTSAPVQAGTVVAGNMDYNMFEAVDAFRRAAATHGWQVPSDLEMLRSMSG
ncbi:hypothetical protein FHETE_8552 [Fusarium heterosporum]|uniref:UBC core domain-containing protein n=1 Tax=Fusarium heterosporum TaxID=42747 RepID=A0A8H5T1C1_FUSHE|nr:hypothetical protein FHETE_8552 [Fusarium heterosporum]